LEICHHAVLIETRMLSKPTQIWIRIGSIS